jgi:AcrR family transcriptional regulator
VRGISDRSMTEQRAATRARLLEAAEVLFAGRGYRGASVRAITGRARCNIAAVNYHFGGKAGLYRTMFRRRLRDLRDRRIRGIRAAMKDAGAGANLDGLLRAFTAAFLEPHLDGEDSRMLVRLFAREMVDPHLSPATVRREIVEPVTAAMCRAFREVGVPVRGRAARRCVQSVVAQLVHVVQMRGAAGGVYAAAGGDFAFPGIIDHIVGFSAAGIRAQVRP